MLLKHVKEMTIVLKFPNEKILERDFLIIQPDVTEKEFWELATEDIKCELLDGVLVIHSPADVEHEDIFRYLLTLLSLYFEKTREGKAYGSRLVMKLEPKWNPEPDILVITPEKYPNLKETHLEGPADIVIEILSKSTRKYDLEVKLPQFLKMGVQEVWIIDPEKKALNVYTTQQHLEFLDPLSQSPFTSAVLPDFWIKPLWLWNRDQYPPGQIITELIS